MRSRSIKTADFGDQKSDKNEKFEKSIKMKDVLIFTIKIQ